MTKDNELTEMDRQKATTLSIRLDPKTAFILDFAIRISGQSKTTFVSRAISGYASTFGDWRCAYDAELAGAKHGLSKKCQKCDTWFFFGKGTGRRSSSKFCSSKCRQLAHREKGSSRNVT